MMSCEMGARRRRNGHDESRDVQAHDCRALRGVLLALAISIACDGPQAASPAPVGARNGMVVTSQHLATKVGVDILKQGGNAVDAAVAVGYALGVVFPAAGNIGGGGFMTVQLADGRAGYMWHAYVRSPVDYRALFNLIGGRWRMTAFVAGD